MKTIELSFKALLKTPTGRLVLRRLFCGGYGKGRPGSYGAKRAYEQFRDFGVVEPKYQQHYRNAQIEWRKLPANGRATLKGAEAATRGDFDHIQSYKNLKLKGQEAGHRNPENMAGFGDPSKNRARGARDMHPKEVAGVKARQRAEAYKAVAEEKGQRYANKVNKQAKRNIKAKQKAMNKAMFEQRLTKAFNTANKAGIYGALTAGLISAAWNLFKLYPSYKRGEITKSELLGEIIIQAAIDAVSGGAVAWILAFIGVLCPPLGAVLGVIATGLFIYNLPKVIEEIKEILKEYEDLNNITREALVSECIIEEIQEVTKPKGWKRDWKDLDKEVQEIIREAHGNVNKMILDNTIPREEIEQAFRELTNLSNRLRMA